MESNTTAVFQIIVKSGQMFYRNKIVNFSVEQFTEFTKKIPDVWWHEKDRIAYFTYYSDGSYFCEREKDVYNYSLKQEEPRIYEFNLFSNEEVIPLYKLFTWFFEEMRLEELRIQKEELRKEIEQKFEFISVQFRTVRDFALKDSDWTQLPDVVESMDENIALMWKKYRQYLRDMTDTDAWKNKEYINIVYPLPPDIFLQRFPEEEYLSSSSHFVGEHTLSAKNMVKEVIRTLNIPTVSDTFENIKDTNDTETLSYLIDITNDYLKQISPDIQIELNVVGTL